MCKFWLPVESYLAENTLSLLKIPIGKEIPPNLFVPAILPIYKTKDLGHIRYYRPIKSI